MTTPTPAQPSTWEVYESTLAELDSGILPTTLLPQTHPFQSFLHRHILALTTTGKYDAVIDAFVSVYTGDALWRSKSSSINIVTQRQEIRSLISKQPLYFVVVEQDVSNGYGFHRRTATMQDFVCITKHYVDAWSGAVRDSVLELALEALLKATMNHELGHWLFTLRVGPFHQAYLDAICLQSPFRQVELSKMSPTFVQENMAKDTPKDLRAAWAGSPGEAGNFVEVQSQGGIIGFRDTLNFATIQTEAKLVYPLERPYLLSFRQESSVRFVPPPNGPTHSSSQGSGSPQRPKAAHSRAPTSPLFFPETDGCFHPIPQGSFSLAGLGLSIRRSECTQRAEAHEAAESFLRGLGSEVGVNSS